MNIEKIDELINNAEVNESPYRVMYYNLSTEVAFLTDYCLIYGIPLNNIKNFFGKAFNLIGQISNGNVPIEVSRDLRFSKYFGIKESLEIETNKDLEWLEFYRDTPGRMITEDMKSRRIDILSRMGMDRDTLLKTYYYSSQDKKAIGLKTKISTEFNIPVLEENIGKLEEMIVNASEGITTITEKRVIIELLLCISKQLAYKG